MTPFCVLFFLLITTVVVAPPQPPTNDDACNARQIYIGDVVVDTLTEDGTSQPNEVTPGQEFNINPDDQDGWYYYFDLDVQNSIWFKVKAFELELEIVAYNDTFGCINTQMAVYTVTDCADFSTFTEIRANDDAGCSLNGSNGTGSSHIFPFTECVTQEYYIQVDSTLDFDGLHTGTFQMNVKGIENGSCPVMTNDDACDATEIAVGDVVVDTLTLAGTSQPNEVTPGTNDSCTGHEQNIWCGGWPSDGYVQNSLWYKVFATELEIEMVSYSGVCINTQLAVYTTTNCADFSTFTKIKANDDGSNSGSSCELGSHILPITSSCELGAHEYYIQVDGYSLGDYSAGLATGVFQMNVMGIATCKPTKDPTSAPTMDPTESSDSNEIESNNMQESDSNSGDSVDRAEAALFENNDLDSQPMGTEKETKIVTLQFSYFTVMNMWLLFCVMVSINVLFCCVCICNKKKQSMGVATNKNRV